MIFAETERLFLRRLEKNELPRLAELIGAWDIVRWLCVVPFPYRLEHAEEFYHDMQTAYDWGVPEFYAMALKTDNLLIGGVGLHAPRNAHYAAGQIEMGYWLGKDFWGRGLMSEAVRKAVDMAFARAPVTCVGANTALSNHASQNVLRKAGLREKGVVARDYQALRGENEIMKWLLTREEYEQGSSA